MRTGIRLAALAALTCLLIPNLGCKGEEAGRREMTIVVEADTERLQEREGELVRQLSHIEDERSRLLQEREALLSRMESGDDLSRLISEQRLLLEQEKQLRRQETLAEEEWTALTEEVSRIVEAAASTAFASETRPSGPGAEATTTAEMSSREAGMATREADLAAREKALAEREARLAEREAEMARLGASRTDDEAAEPGRRVTSSMVESEHRRVRNHMRRRGLLVGDLPPEVAALNRRIYQLSRQGRWNEALDAVESLSDAVSAMAIDEAFIQAKMERLGRARRGKELSSQQGREVEDLLAQATSAFADGKHAEANSRLNRISAILSN